MENNAQRENRENKIEQKKLLDIRHERGKWQNNNYKEFVT